MSRKARVLGIWIVVAVLMLATTVSAQADGHHYVVRPGDTLYAIGRRYGVSPFAIAAANHLANPNLIYVGQVLRIPGGWSPPPPAPEPPPWTQYVPYVPEPPAPQPPWRPPAPTYPEPVAVSSVGTCATWLQCIPTGYCGLGMATGICRDGTCTCSYDPQAACAWRGGLRCVVARRVAAPHAYGYTPWSHWR